MVDPENPQYKKPYCWKCKGHTPFKTRTVTSTSDYGRTGSSRKVHDCLVCDDIMKEPRVMDSAYYGPWGVGCLSVYFIITSAGLLFFAIDGAANGEHDKIFWVLGMLALLAFLLLVLPIVVLLRAAKRYATWKKWAEERGWVEPPRKERAWKKGDS